MRIIGAEHLSGENLADELRRGGKFVQFTWALSVIILSFRLRTDIYYLRPGESAVGKAIPFVLLSCVAGWWGFPFGPIFTLWAIIENLSGGRNVTGAVVAALQVPVSTQAARVIAVNPPPVQQKPGL